MGRPSMLENAGKPQTWVVNAIQHFVLLPLRKI
jgi:hypothetical protein